jgi:metal-responsive CopG/Arc/MetJ family transcriptional regulator
MANRRVELMLSDTQMEFLDRVSKKTGTNRSNLIRWAIFQWMEWERAKANPCPTARRENQ